MDEDALVARLGRRGAVLALVGVELVHLGRLALGEADEVVVVRLADDVAWVVVSEARRRGDGNELTGKAIREAEAHALVGALVEVVEAGMGSVGRSEGCTASFEAHLLCWLV